MIPHGRIYSANTTCKVGRRTDTGLCVWLISLQASFRPACLLPCLVHLVGNQSMDCYCCQQGRFRPVRFHCYIIYGTSAQRIDDETRSCFNYTFSISVLLLFQFCFLVSSIPASSIRFTVQCSAVQCSAVLEGFRTIGRKTIQYQLTPLGTVRTRRKRENFGKHVCVGFG